MKGSEYDKAKYKASAFAIGAAVAAASAADKNGIADVAASDAARALALNADLEKTNVAVADDTWKRSIAKCANIVRKYYPDGPKKARKIE